VPIKERGEISIFDPCVVFNVS